VVCCPRTFDMGTHTLLHSIASGLLAAALTLALAAPVDADPGLPDDEAQNPTVRTDVMPDRCTNGLSIPAEPGSCRLTPRRFERPTVVLWGDSHVWHHIPGLRAEANAQQVNLIAFVMGACPPVAGQERRPLSACARNAKQALAYITRLRERDRPVRVVLGAHWQFYRKLNARLAKGWVPRTESEVFRAGQAELFARGGERAFEALAALRVRTAVLGQAPWVPDHRTGCPAGEEPYRCDLPRRQAIAGETGVRAWLAAETRSLRRPWSIDVAPRLCDRTVCHAEVDGVDTYLDDLHLNPGLSLLLRELYRPALRFR